MVLPQENTTIEVERGISSIDDASQLYRGVVTTTSRSPTIAEAVAVSRPQCSGNKYR